MIYKSIDRPAKIFKHAPVEETVREATDNRHFSNLLQYSLKLRLDMKDWTVNALRCH